jgi:hypothetical protein
MEFSGLVQEVARIATIREPIVGKLLQLLMA